MDDSTIALHKTLLRLLKGVTIAYDRWIELQVDASAVQNLRRLKKAFTPLDTEKKEK